jgi:hypothetical protein
MERLESSDSITISTPPQLSPRDEEVSQYGGPPPRRGSSGRPRILMYGEEEDVVSNVATQSTGKLTTSRDAATEAPQRRLVTVPFYCPFVCQGVKGRQNRSICGRSDFARRRVP